MVVQNYEFEMDAFNEQNIESLLNNLALNVDNYFIAMTKPSLLNRAIFGTFSDFGNRYCIVCFSEIEVTLIMLSRLSNKKVTETIKIPRNEITNVKLSNILISYMLNIKTNDSSIKFQAFKKVAGFTKIKNSIETFKRMFMLG